MDVLPHATTHADTVLFVTCLAILGALLLEMPSKRTFRLALVLSPLFLWAIRANNRRLAYADLALLVVVFWMLTPWRPFKRRVARVLVALSLPILLYVGVGWGSQAGAFGPVQKFRSMVDSKADSSTLWRDLENFNLVFTFKEHPLLGLGFGRPFEQKIRAARRDRPVRAGAVRPAQQRGGTLGLRGAPGLRGALGSVPRGVLLHLCGPTAGPRRRWNG